MPIYEYDGPTAARNLQANTASRWYKAGAKANDRKGSLAFQRLGRGMFEPLIHPEFSFTRADSIYAIGSCFARGIESTLVGMDYKVESFTDRFDDVPMRTKGTTRLGYMNKYNTWAIRQELQWALDPQQPWSAESLVPIDDGRWVDPHMNPTLEFADRDEMLRRRIIIQEITQKVTDCRVVVITLGLIEIWRDNQTGLYLNMTPSPEMMRNSPGRFSFEVLDYQQNRANLDAIHQTLTAFGRPDMEIVVTVSPVPLMATFTMRDVVIANTFSKSMLRVAAEEWAVSQPNVHYFPSYEIVMNSPLRRTWEADRRHVTGKVAKHIIGLLIKHYVRQ